MLLPLRSISRHFCPSLLVPLCITVSHSSPRPRSMAGSTGQSLNLLTPLAVPKGMDLFRLRDGTRAGLVWDVGEGEIQEICPPDPERWGVYQVWFPRLVHNVDDLCDCFAHVLPALRKKH